MRAAQERLQRLATNDAYARVAAAYKAARRDVYDLHPAGLPAYALLTQHQRGRLLELSYAERDLDAVRTVNRMEFPDLL